MRLSLMTNIKTVANELVEASRHMYEVFGMELSFRLSFRDDGDGYLGNPELWDKAQQQIEELAKENGLDYYIEEGEAAFYGPKVDFMATDAIGRKWQVATVQLDFVQPERFGLEYISEDGTGKRPVMILTLALGSLGQVPVERQKNIAPVGFGARAPEQVSILC